MKLIFRVGMRESEREGYRARERIDWSSEWGEESGRVNRIEKGEGERARERKGEYIRKRVVITYE